MNDAYLNTVRLLLKCTPTVFHSGLFALKGGTAINLFIRDTPRLSVDLDLVYINHEKSRDQALEDISNAIKSICTRLQSQGITAHIKPGAKLDSKIFISENDITVKVEINHVMRGVVSTVVNATITQAVKDRFKMNVTAPMLSANEVYAGKLVAAMDRQHPRDLFDVHQLMENEGVSMDMIGIFVAYLACHNRPIHEVLFSNMLDIEKEYKNNFVGMAEKDISLETLIDTREKLFNTVRSMLTSKHKQFLFSLAKAEPAWPLVDIPHLENLPGMRWKLQNLNILKDKDPTKLKYQADQLELLFEHLKL